MAKSLESILDKVNKKLLVSKSYLLEKGPNFLKKNIADSTALVAILTPISAGLEMLAGMSPEVSMSARVINAVALYAGIGYAYGAGRDKWRNMFNITKTTAKKVQDWHGRYYMALCSLIVTPPFYYLSSLFGGPVNAYSIAGMTAISVGIAFTVGSYVDNLIDKLRYSMGVKESLNTHEYNIQSDAQQKPKKAKNALAALAVALSLGITAGIYLLAPDAKPTYNMK